MTTKGNIRFTWKLYEYVISRYEYPWKNAIR